MLAFSPLVHPDSRLPFKCLGYGASLNIVDRCQPARRPHGWISGNLPDDLPIKGQLLDDLHRRHNHGGAGVTAHEVDRLARVASEIFGECPVDADFLLRWLRILFNRCWLLH